MSWQQMLVVGWMQFALGAAVILGLTRIALRWIPQPVERARLIQYMISAVFAVPLLSALSPFPSWGLGLIPHREEASTANVVEAPREASTGMLTQRSVASGESVERPTPPEDDSDTMHHRENRDTNLTDLPQPATSGLGATSFVSPSFISRLATIDIWSIQALAILLLHAAAASYFVIHRAIGKLRLRRLCRSAVDASTSVRQAWSAIAGQRGQGVRLLISHEVDAPLVFGWLRPVVVIPFALAAKSGSRLDACLAHEWSHVERSDMLTWHFVNLCQFVLWYQPAFWSLRRELCICQEFLADHRSATSTMESLEYSELLLQLAKGRRSRGAVGALTMFDQPSQLARRIKMLVDDRMSLCVRCRRRVTGGILVFAALLSVAISCLRVDSTQADVEIIQPAEKTSFAESDDKVEPVSAAASEKALEAGQQSEPGATPAGRTVSYKQLMVTEGRQVPTVVKDYVAKDGRMRSELAGSTTVFDKSGRIRLTLSERPKTAHVYEPKGNQDYNAGGGRLRWLQSIRDLVDLPDKDLGVKELEGKQAKGFVATQGDRTYTIWIDSATGDLVRVEYDTTLSGSPGHITMSDFRFDEKLNEALFSFEVPAGYNVLKRVLVASELDSPEKRAADAPSGMQQAWSHKGTWRAVTAIPQPPALFALSYGQLVTLDEQGKKLAELKSEQPKLIRVGDLDGDGRFEFVTVENSGSTVKAYSLDGTLRWTYGRGKEPGHDWSVNDLCLADLNSDGHDEVIVGFSGSTGLHVLDSQGKLLWKDTSQGNVWHVAAGNVDGDARPEVVTTSGGGKVRIFKGEGVLLRVLDAGFYANMVRTWQPPETDKPNGIVIAAGTHTGTLKVIAGGGVKKEMVAALDGQGKVLWSLDLPIRVVSATTSKSKPWLALTLADGTARVIDVVAGKRIAHVGGQGDMTDAAWLPTQQGAPLLVIANGAALNAFKIDAEMP